MALFIELCTLSNNEVVWRTFSFWWISAAPPIHLSNILLGPAPSFHFRFLAIFAYWVLGEPLIRLVWEPQIGYCWVRARRASPFSLSRRRKKSTWLGRRGCNLVMGLPLLHISHSLSRCIIHLGIYISARAECHQSYSQFCWLSFLSSCALAKGKQRFFLTQPAIFNIIILLYWMGLADMRFFRISSTHSLWLACVHIKTDHLTNGSNLLYAGMSCVHSWQLENVFGPTMREKYKINQSAKCWAVAHI